MSDRRSPSPFGLSRAKAWALLLPPEPSQGFDEGVEPWEPWAKPSPSRDIDKCVAHLEDPGDVRRAKRRLRTREELEAIGINCPYLHAREHVVQAVADAVDWSRQMAAVTLDRARDWDEEAEQLRKAAADLLDILPLVERAALRVPPARPASHLSRGEEREGTARLNRAVSEAKGIAAYFEEVAANVNALRRHVRPKNDPGYLWQQVVAERLGYCWRDLTGDDPSPNSPPFIKFLDAAFVSLGGERGILSWAEPVKTAVGRVLGVKKKGCAERVGGRPEWDRFDRLERGLGPPGGRVVYRPIEELMERKARRRRLFESQVIGWLDAATPEAERAAWFTLIEDWSFVPDDERNREEVERIATARKAGTLESAPVSRA